MCDYSLEHKKVEEAEKGMRIISTQFHDTPTIGFSQMGHTFGDSVVCLRPGTEVAFEHPVRYDANAVTESHVARFTQVDKHITCVQHDVLEFASGERVFVAALYPGQIATVVQLPVEERIEEKVQIDVVTSEVILAQLRTLEPIR